MRLFAASGGLFPPYVVFGFDPIIVFRLFLIDMKPSFTLVWFSALSYELIVLFTNECIIYY